MAASRTRGALLVALAVLTGLYADIVYRPTYGVAAGYVGFVIGAVAALALGAVIGAIVERRSSRL